MPTSSDTRSSYSGRLVLDQRFWQRYSPRHEAPLSGLGSLTLHVGVAGALVLLGLLGWAGFSPRHSVLPVDPVFSSESRV
jgi:hypothetical protein